MAAPTPSRRRPCATAVLAGDGGVGLARKGSERIGSESNIACGGAGSGIAAAAGSIKGSEGAEAGHSKHGARSCCCWG